MKVVFNTKLRNVFRAICMEESELEKPQVFFEKGNILDVKCIIINNLTFFFPLQQVVAEHRIVAPEGTHIEVFNSKRAPISFEIFPILVRQHINDPNFFIEIRVYGPGVFVLQSEVGYFDVFSL